MSGMKTISTAALVASIALLTACGGGGNNDGDNTQSSGSIPPQNTPNAPADNTGGATGSPAPGTAPQPPDGNSGSGSDNPTSAASYGYIVQAATNASSMTADTRYTGGSILKCEVDANGMLTACGASGTPTLNNPLTITFSGSTAYIINQTAPDLEGGTGRGGQYRVLKCTAQADGSLSGCADTLPGGSLENEFAFKIISNSKGGYVLKERQLLNCPSDFSSKCATDPNSQVFPAGASAIDMILANNRLYVVNTGFPSDDASILSFEIDPVTGHRSAESKTVTDASFDQALRHNPSAVDSPREIAINGSNAYIVTRYGNRVIQCSYNSTANTMTACVPTAPLAGLADLAPRHLAVQGSYAYITDTSQTAAQNSIVRCTIGAADGKFESCAVVPGLTFTTPIADIAFH
jgi:hypothetical protein